MTDEAAGAEASVRDEIADGVVVRVMEAFSLGEVQRVGFIAEGLMNRNWRIETAQGVFALKQIVDVPVPKARRSLNVLGALSARGLPVCAPRLSASADAVAEIDGRSYCLFPWAAGTHRSGVVLELGEATNLGLLLGEIHRSLAAPDAGLAADGRGPACEGDRA